jgi:hypothetical protein
VSRQAARNKLVVLSETLDGRDGPLLTVEVLRTGRLRTVLGRRLTAADRERCADWVQDWWPELSHDQRYELLFG